MTSLNLYQKLVEVRKNIDYIKKEGTGFNYKYTKESHVLGSIKASLDENKIWIDLDMDNIENVEVYTKPTKSVAQVKLGGIKAWFTFTVTNADNPEEQIVKKQILQDVGSEVKTIGGLETYANRYFLLKFFNIPTDNDDPDKFENALELSQHNESTQKISEKEAKELNELITNKSFWDSLKSKYGFSKLSQLSIKQYKEIKSTVDLFNHQEKLKQNQ